MSIAILPPGSTRIIYFARSVSPSPSSKPHPGALMIPLPSSAPRCESSIAVTWLHPDGLLIAQSKSIQRNVTNITENILAVHGLAGGKPMPLLVYLTSSPMPDKATRRFVNESLPGVYSAMAMVSDSRLSALIMNFLFGLKPPPIPMKSFRDENQAFRWLKAFSSP